MPAHRSRIRDAQLLVVGHVRILRKLGSMTIAVTDTQSTTRAARDGVIPHRSLWLQEALAGDAPDAPPLRGGRARRRRDRRRRLRRPVDGARIKQQEPGCDVVVLEQDICGGGASGRNGGFVLTWWAKFAVAGALLRRGGRAAMARPSEAAIDEIGAFCDEHGIDAHFAAAGGCGRRRTRGQLGAWETPSRRCERLGRRRVPAAGARGGRAPAPARRVHLRRRARPTGATVQPAAARARAARVGARAGRAHPRAHPRARVRPRRAAGDRAHRAAAS